MHPDTPFQHFVGVDWAKDHHDIVVLDAAGQSVETFTITHSAAGWRELAERLKPYPDVALCVESGHWLVIEQLFVIAAVVFVVPARSAAAYRLRKAPSGAKNDRFDAWALAAALRTEHADWTPIRRPDELTHRLRTLCRDHVALIENRTSFINQLKAALREYYPAALEAFELWQVPSAWAFLERFPDPETLVEAGRRKWEKFLHVHRLARASVYEKRMEIFAGAAQLAGSKSVAQAKRLLALSLVKMIRCVTQQITAYEEEVKPVVGRRQVKSDGEWIGVTGKNGFWAGCGISITSADPELYMWVEITIPGDGRKWIAGFDSETKAAFNEAKRYLKHHEDLEAANFNKTSGGNSRFVFAKRVAGSLSGDGEAVFGWLYRVSRVAIARAQRVTPRT